MSSNPGRVIEIFTEAVQLPVEERADFVQRACADDEALRRKVEALLGSNDRVTGFMEEPASAVSGTRTRFVAGEKPGDVVDRYKLLQQIGEGGCGVVFLAEQQTPVVRRVALKVIKPGMDTRSVIARFEAERQTLALMDHPNIARVLDAGATESGRPYFVMELVEGTRITDYCDRHSLPTSARLELFIQVCDAIQHAHQKGIIHRDIKPSNILVATSADGKPVPKVIDFGIAKATTDQPLTDKTIFTSWGMLIGTPAYMSPEQATLASAELDTRTDIYSLGVLLYELLTGTTPFDTRELLKAGVDEVRRVIREEEPVRPSTRLSTMVPADVVNISKCHGAEVLKLIREMQGDLDWIVMKALEKDRARRYSTANGLSMDVERYLSGEVVLARPPSATYKFQKLIRRNRVLFGTLSLFAVVIAIAFVLISMALTREQAARREAEADKVKSEEVVHFLEEMLAGAGPSVARTRDATVLREILDKTARRLTVELTNQPAVQADLRVRLGKVYADIGQPAQAAAMFREALATRTKLAGEETQATSDVMLELGRVLDVQSDEGEKYVRRALEVRQKLFGEDNARVAECYMALGSIFWRRSQLPQAQIMLRKSLEILRKLPGDNSVVISDSLLGLGTIAFNQGNYREAEELFKDTLRNWEKALNEDHPSMVQCLNSLATVLAVQGKDAEAEPLIRRALAVRRNLYSEAHPAVINSLQSLSRFLLLRNRFDEAELPAREALAAARKIWGDSKEETLVVLRDLINALLQQGKFKEAELLFGDLLPPQRASNPEYAGLRYERCDTYARCQRWREAADDAVALLKQFPENPDNYHTLAPLLVQLGDVEGHQRLCQTILERFGATTDIFVADRMAKDCLIAPSSRLDFATLAAMADVAATRGSNAPAAAYFQFCKSLAEFRRNHYDEAIKWANLAVAGPLPHPKAGAYSVIAMSRFALNQPTEARAAVDECRRIVEEQLPGPDQELGRDWRDWIVVHALYAEAGRMINGAPVVVTPEAVSSR